MVDGSRLAGQVDVTDRPANYKLFTVSQYLAVVIERDARPTVSEYVAVLVDRDSRPTKEAYEAEVAQRDARPTVEAYDTAIAERDARLESVSHLSSSGLGQISWFARVSRDCDGRIFCWENRPGCLWQQ